MELLHSDAEKKKCTDIDKHFLLKSKTTERQLSLDYKNLDLEEIVNNAITYRCLNQLYQLLVDQQLTKDTIYDLVDEAVSRDAKKKVCNDFAPHFHSATLVGSVSLVQELPQKEPPKVMEFLETTFGYTVDLLGRRHPRQFNCFQLAAAMGHTDLIEYFFDVVRKAADDKANNFLATTTKPPPDADDDNDDDDDDPDADADHSLTPLMLAARFGHVTTVRTLLKLKLRHNGRDFDVNFRSTHGYTALHFAVCYDQRDCVDALVSQGGANVNAQTDGYVKYPLAFAAGLGHGEITHQLVGETERDGQIRAICVAVAMGRLNEVKVLLTACSALIDAEDCNRHSLLAIALDGKHASIVELLVHRSVWGSTNSGKDVISDVSETATKVLERILNRIYFQLAVSQGEDNVERIQRLLFVDAVQNNDAKTIEQSLRQGVDPNTTDVQFGGGNFIHFAAAENHVDVIDTFLGRYEHLLGMANSIGEKPIHVAIRKGHIDAVKSLIRNVSTLDMCDQNGQTPLLLAAKYHREEIMEILVDAIQSIGWYKILNRQDNKGRTALFYALSSKVLSRHCSRCVSILSTLAPSVRSPPDKSYLVLHHAASLQKPEVLKLVLETFFSTAGRKLSPHSDFRDRSGRTALMICVDNNDAKSVELLLKYNVNLKGLVGKNLTVLHRMVIESTQSPEKAQSMLQLYRIIEENVVHRKKTNQESGDDLPHLLTEVLSEGAEQFGADVPMDIPPLSVLQFAAAAGADVLLQAFLDTMNPPDDKNVVNYRPKDVIPRPLYTKISTETEPRNYSALELIFLVGHQHADKMVTITPINKFFRRFARFRTLVYLLLTVCHLIHMITFSLNVLPTCVSYNHTVHNGKPVFTCFLIWPSMIAIYLLLRLLIYGNRLRTKRTKAWNFRYLKSVFSKDFSVVFNYNIFKITNYVLSISFIFFHVAWFALWKNLDDSNLIRYVQVVSVIFVLGWIYTIEYLKGIKFFHAFSKYIKLILVKDMLRFAVIYSLVLIGFSLAIQIYIQIDRDVDPQLIDDSTFVTTMLSSFGLMIGITSVYGTDDPDHMHYGFLYDGDNPLSAKIMFSLYLCLSTIVLLNVLIAMLNSSYALIDDRMHHSWIYENMKLTCDLADVHLWFVEEPIRLMMRLFVFEDKDGNLTAEYNSEPRMRTPIQEDHEKDVAN